MLKLFNTMGREKQEFHPIEPGRVRLYACGPTVYAYAHIGNLRTYVFEDVLKRVLLYLGYAVRHVMNITDVGHLTSDADTGEDKMELAAQREGKDIWEIAKFYTEAFQRDIEKLNVLPPDVWCRATDHIEDMIDMVRRLEANGLAYPADDGVYYDTSKFDRYTELARLDLEGLMEGARIEANPNRRNKSDFALWKFSPPGRQRQMEWDSPWGRGFPGWHIECSTMAVKYLGETLDIHCGGIDHVPVHHTNEIAQAEGATGKRFVNYWVHGEFLQLDRAKMAKSAGTFLTLSELEGRGYEPMDYRYFCLTAHYRSGLTFTWDALDGARAGYVHLAERIGELAAETPPDTKDDQPERQGRHRQAFREAICDDLNAPSAIAALWTALRDETLSPSSRLALARDFDAVLGLGIDQLASLSSETPAHVQQLVAQREQARRRKNWAEADKLRDAVLAEGFSIKDTAQGPKVSPLRR